MHERRIGNRQPALGFVARATSSDAFKFQLVVYTTSRNGQDMMKTFDPHAKLLTEQETKKLGYNTEGLINRALEQRFRLATEPPGQGDIPEESFDEFQMRRQWNMLTEDNQALFRARRELARDQEYERLDPFKPPDIF